MILNIIFFNRYFDKNRLKALILWSLTKSGEKTTIDLVEKLKDIGFSYATQAGLSLSIDDLKIPPNKSKLILEAEISVQDSQKDYEIGNVTIVEKFQQLIDIWHRTSEILKQNVVEHFRSTNILNPVYMMAFSGARGNISQVRQLVGMRGLMADPQGQILDFPIRSNFREGLTLTEYVISCYGARKGLVDTALRTANSGYLTRRLIDVAQHIIVRQLDCGTANGILITDMKDGEKIIFSLQKRLIGRVLAESIEKIGNRNQDISPSLSLKISKVRNQVLVRSPLSCEAKNSICQLCYGWSLAHGSLVSLGEAVGILAAQSIGEPGTQLTMRTFHTGGVFSGDVMQEIRSPISGKISFSSPLQGILIRTLHGKIAFLTKVEGVLNLVNKTTTNSFSYNLPASTVLFVRQYELVKERQLLAEYSSVVTSSNQGVQAKYNLNSTIEGEVYFENVLLVVKSGKEGDINKTALKFGSLWVLSGKLYQSIIRSNLFIKSNDLVDTKTILNESLLVTPYTGSLKKCLNEKKQYKFLTKKNNNTFNSNQITNNLIFDKKILIQNERSLKKYQTKKFEKNQFFVNQNFTEINFKHIQYKKFGYYISLTKDSKNKIFLPISLNDHEFSLKSFSLQWFSNFSFKKSEIALIDNNFIYEKRGQFFLISKSLYKVNPNNLVPIFHFKQLSIIQENTPLFLLQNKQGNTIEIKAQNSGFINKEILLTNKKNLSNLKFNYLLSKNYRKNPTKLLLEKSQQNKIISSKKHNFQNLVIPISLRLNKRKIRKKLFNENSFFNILQKEKDRKEGKFFSNENNLIQEKNNQIAFNLNNKKEFFFNLNSSWIFLANKHSEFFLKNKDLFAPTYKTINFHFDQNYIYKKTICSKNTIVFFIKNKNFTKIRYINNKFFRYNKFQNQKQPFLKKEKETKEKFSILFLTNKTEKNLPNLESFVDTTIKITRNKLYLKNFKITFLQIVEIEKAHEIQLFNELEEKRKFQKLITNSRNFQFFDVNSFLLNKQKITQLTSPFPNFDIKIKNNVSITQEQQKVFSAHPLLISFFHKNLSLFNEVQLKISFGQNCQFSTSRKIQPINFLFSENKKIENKSTKVIVTRDNQILEQNIFTKNSFFSSLPGEITTIKRNLIGKEKSLLLTNKDKISFLNDQKNSLVKIGQLVRYGEQILKNIAITESGQIIQIDENKITLRKAQPILFSSQGVFHIDNGDIIEKNSPLITLFYQKLKTEDIVQGIPKIEELFEARQTKEGEALQENLHSKLSQYFNLFKQQYSSQEAARKSIEKIQQILVNNVQKVYQSQGVSIADKHIEIIVRQMTTKVKITESGRTGLLRGELIDLEWVEIINLGIEAQNELTHQGIEVEKAEYEPIILGITKAALETESFISASSFQETTRILSRAAIERKTDFLRGLKENVILGHLIPAGTGFSLSFDSQVKISNNLHKLSWLSYKNVISKFAKINEK